MNGFAHRKPSSNMAPRRRIDFSRPGFDCFYWLGVQTARNLDVRSTWSEIGRTVGLTKQNAFTAGMVALGKIVFEIRRLRDRRPQA